MHRVPGHGLRMHGIHPRSGDDYWEGRLGIARDDPGSPWFIRDNLKPKSEC